MRESDIHYARWIFDRREKNWFNIILLSLVLHALFFFLLHSVKSKEEIVADQAPASIKVNFSHPSPEHVIENKKNDKRRILTDTKPNSSVHFYSNLEKKAKKKEDSPQAKPENNLSSFLPNSDNNYVNALRQQNSAPSKSIQTDDGDIPIEGPSLAPTNEPRVLSRYAEKDMSLFQFTQEFRERFGAIWSSEDRVVPPTSPLRPGDIVYYKIFINSNGSLLKFENISQSSRPQKDYSDLDKIFSHVIARVFPMSVPPKFAHKNIVLTEVVAIQVVDRNVPVRFSS